MGRLSLISIRMYTGIWNQLQSSHAFTMFLLEIQCSLFLVNVRRSLDKKTANTEVFFPLDGVRHMDQIMP